MAADIDIFATYLTDGPSHCSLILAGAVELRDDKRNCCKRSLIQVNFGTNVLSVAF